MWIWVRNIIVIIIIIIISSSSRSRTSSSSSNSIFITIINTFDISIIYRFYHYKVLKATKNEQLIPQSEKRVYRENYLSNGGRIIKLLLLLFLFYTTLFKVSLAINISKFILLSTSTYFHVDIRLLCWCNRCCNFSPVDNVDFDVILTEIAKGLYKNSDISVLGKALGFGPADIGRKIEENAKQGGNCMGTLDLLRMWRNKQTPSTEKAALRLALSNVGFKNLAEQYLSTPVPGKRFVAWFLFALHKSFKADHGFIVGWHIIWFHLTIFLVLYY